MLRAARSAAVRCLLLVILVALPSPRAAACSICRCGDATFNALGASVYTAGAFRLAVDWDRFDKENTVSQGEEGSTLRRRRPFDATNGLEEEVENRVTATLSYSFGESVNAVVRVPWSSRSLTETVVGESLTTDTHGLSDPEFLALVRIWASPLAAGVGRRAWVSGIAGVKTPWGQNDLQESGVRLDEHVQSGTGATDVFTGVSGFYLIDPVSSVFASFQYRWTGANGFGYEYGDSATATVAYEHKLGQAADALLGVDYRHADRDTVDADGALDPNTGGGILYLTPRVVVALGKGLVARISAQIPLSQNLYGEQKEHVVGNAGLTYLFD